MLAVIRIKGMVHLSPAAKMTLKLLKLDRVNQCVLMIESNEIKKMIKKINSLITYGEINQTTLKKMLEKRGRITGNKKIGIASIQENNFKDLEDLTGKIIASKKGMKDFSFVKPIFRLAPPKKGFERRGIKRSFTIGGAAGYRGQKINELLVRMI